MEPRQQWRGNLQENPDAGGLSAASMEPRQQWRGNLVPVPLAPEHAEASMEPRQQWRGNARQGTASTLPSPVLQWSRANNGAETCSAMYFRLFSIQLQWSRANNGAET